MAVVRSSTVGRSCALLAIMLYIAMALPILQPALAVTSGGPSLEDADLAGCHCHNLAPDAGITLNLMGLPEVYDPMQVYELVITVAGGPPVDEGMLNQGGFMVSCTNGTFSVPDGSDQVQVWNDGTMASHTAAGARTRQWRLRWNAPTEGTGDAVFHLSANSVNGDGVETGELDAYNQLRTFSAGSPQDIDVEEGVSEWGVPISAYWMGTISFVATLVLTWAAYYIIRGTSRRHEVHIGSRRRYVVEERSPPSSFGATLLVAMLTIIEVVAAVVLVRGIVEGASDTALSINLAVVLALFVAILAIYRSAFIPRLAGIEPEETGPGEGV